MLLLPVLCGRSGCRSGTSNGKKKTTHFTGISLTITKLL